MQTDYDAPAPRNPGVYMSKYIGKDMETTGNTARSGVKRYWSSRHLTPPVHIAGSEISVLLQGKHTILHQRTHKIQCPEGKRILTLKTVRLHYSPFDAICKTLPNTPHDRRKKNAHDRLLVENIINNTAQIREGHQYDDKIRQAGGGRLQGGFERKCALDKATGEDVG
jgi:hypothetical protein